LNHRVYLGFTVHVGVLLADWTGAERA